MITAPASRRFFVSVASYGGVYPANASAPPGRRHVGGVNVVFQRDRNAVQRPADPAGRALAIERVGVLEGARVDGDSRVHAVLVQREAHEVLLHELM
jgi:hypothetical protein